MTDNARGDDNISTQHNVLYCGNDRYKSDVMAREKCLYMSQQTHSHVCQALEVLFAEMQPFVFPGRRTALPSTLAWLS